MIHKLFSSLADFKTLTFRPGLNILLADRSLGSTERQTRNGAGKTSFVEVVHFLLGASLVAESPFRAPALRGSSFGMTFDLSGGAVTVERVPQSPSRIIVVTGDTTRWPISPSVDKRSRELVISNENWKGVLGALMFGLQDENGASEQRFRPGFRSLISYFARRQMSGGFLKPEQQSVDQSLWDQQVNLSFILGLDWTIPQRLQEVRQREKALVELRRAAREGVFGAIVGSAADLRTRLTVAQARSDRIRDELSRFRVVPQYGALEVEASQLTGQLAALSNENTIDQELATRLEESIASEVAPAAHDLRRVYEGAGVLFPDVAARRFDDVERFHRSILENRRAHLRSEIDAARVRINRRDREKDRLDERRAQVMGILRAGGALDHFARLQAEYSRGEAETETLRQRYQAAEQLESEKTELDIERARLQRRLQDDYHEQSELIRDAILTFEELSNALYERAGSLTFAPTANGPLMEVRIEASRSRGIANMQMFCFDMMLVESLARRGLGPGFLIHDSHLFDGVDERQVAKALELGAARAEALGFQYIVTLNSDMLPRAAFGQNFGVDDYLLDVRLTDATEDGGLFGIRFE